VNKQQQATIGMRQPSWRHKKLKLFIMISTQINYVKNWKNIRMEN